MNAGQKIILIIGAAFLALGIPMTVIFSVVFSYAGMGAVALLPLIFVILGIVLIIIPATGMAKTAAVRKHGTRYAAKIYGYTEDTSYTVNGAYPVDVKVRYFDPSGNVREAVIPTRFAAGSMDYPIGMTMDIYEYHGKYSWDPGTVRNERLFGEDELMDNKPVEPEKLHMVSVTCPHCGATFSAARGYASRCPYCGQSVDA